MGHHSITRLRTAADIATDAAVHCPVAGLSADPGAAGDIGMRQDAHRLIGELQSRRRMLGCSLTEIAGRCAIDAPALDQWEHGLSVPRLDAVQRWAASLGLHVVLVPAEMEARQGLRVDWPARRVAVDGTPVRLTPMEWKALERLAREPGQVVTHQALFHHLYGEERGYRAQSTAIRVLITKLRRLLPLRIEAQWGKGYVLTGVAPSLPEAHEERDGLAEKAAAAQPAAATAACDRSVPAAPPLNPTAAVAGARLAGIDDGAGIDDRKMSRLAAPPPRHAACRSEELGVIERFLAERGVTRCPDVATIQSSPLQPLVWDKAKRKWVRPSPAGREAV